MPPAPNALPFGFSVSNAAKASNLLLLLALCLLFNRVWDGDI